MNTEEVKTGSDFREMFLILGAELLIPIWVNWCKSEPERSNEPDGQNALLCVARTTGKMLRHLIRDNTQEVTSNRPEPGTFFCPWDPVGRTSAR
jgi:hypothetical protein